MYVYSVLGRRTIVAVPFSSVLAVLTTSFPDLTEISAPATFSSSPAVTVNVTGTPFFATNVGASVDALPYNQAPPLLPVKANITLAFESAFLATTAAKTS